MQRVITINLNGNAYQLDETAYNALRAYLSLAEDRLADNPDRAEILADFEQAIADKFRRFLGPSKTVVTAVEMEQIVTEMGPVEGTATAPPAGDAEPAASAASSGTTPPYKRLYRIRDGAMATGVCMGLSAYFNIDVAIVRTLFVVATVLSGGIGWLVYMAMSVIVPEAETSDERAAAHGHKPFNAQDIIDQAKRTAADVTSTLGASSREWRRQWRVQQRMCRKQWGRPMSGYRPTPVWVGYALPAFSLIGVAMLITLVWAMNSLFKTGEVWGWTLPVGVPIWVGVVVVLVLFQIATAPMRAARHASYYWGQPSGWFAAWDGLLATAGTLLVIWLLYTHMPPTHDFREFMQNLPEAMRSLGHDIQVWLKALTDALREKSDHIPLNAKGA